MPQQFGIAKAGLGIMVTATIGCLMLLLCFGGMTITNSFGDDSIAIWYTSATVVCFLSLAGKLVCGFGPACLGSTTMLVISLVLDVLLAAMIVSFSFGITIPGVQDQVHHLIIACLFVASTYSIIRWLNLIAENADSRNSSQNTKRANWLIKAALASAIGIIVAIAIDARVESVTGIIAMVLVVACVLMMAVCLVLQTTAMIQLIGKLSRS